MQRAAPPGADFDGFRRAEAVEDRVAEVSGGELVHCELVEQRVLCGAKIELISRGAVEGEIEPQPVALRASLGASFLWRPRFRDTACNEEVSGVSDVLPRGDGSVEPRLIVRGEVEVKHAADAAKIAVDMVAGPALDALRDLSAQIAVFRIVGCRVER